MESFNPLADVMRASVASLARNLGRTEEEIKAEKAAVGQIEGQAISKIIDLQSKLSDQQDADQKRRLASGMVQGTPEWETFIKNQQKAMDALNRVLANIG